MGLEDDPIESTWTVFQDCGTFQPRCGPVHTLHEHVCTGANGFRPIVACFRAAFGSRSCPVVCEAGRSAAVHGALRCSRTRHSVGHLNLLHGGQLGLAERALHGDVPLQAGLDRLRVPSPRRREADAWRSLIITVLPSSMLMRQRPARGTRLDCVDSNSSGRTARRTRCDPRRSAAKSDQGTVRMRPDRRERRCHGPRAGRPESSAAAREDRTCSRNCSTRGWWRSRRFRPISSRRTPQTDAAGWRKIPARQRRRAARGNYVRPPMASRGVPIAGGNQLGTGA